MSQLRNEGKHLCKPKDLPHVEIFAFEADQSLPSLPVSLLLSAVEMYSCYPLCSLFKALGDFSLFPLS